MKTIFNTEVVAHLEQPLFLGEDPNISRFETTKHSVFEQLTEKQLSFFWRPEEVDLTLDAQEFERMPEHWKHVFTQNLKYQSLLDSVQGRAPTLALLPIVSDVSLENWITTWGFSETIHSRSYTHIMRNLYANPSEIFDEIILDDAIMKRAKAVTEYYDRLMRETHKLEQLKSMQLDEAIVLMQETDVKEALYLCMHAVNALEAIRFYVSFACTFNFAEQGIMEGNAKVMKLIARDEQLHLKGTQALISLWQNYKDDPEMARISEALQSEAEAIFIEVAEQEKEWANSLFSKGTVPGLNAEILCTYVEYLTNSLMNSAGLNSPYPKHKHPLPWIKKWLNSDSVQVAAQEAELSSYLVGQLDSTVRPEFLETLEV
ncbi:ribonucleoside diphosphate reductase 1, beta subunit, ferritin-like [Vibrio phage 6E35.1a]|nr:ribonucleoside diphosphate reductase 1, beta subunit, ferritin-like [Vibrio phage 6E35.1a]